MACITCGSNWDGSKIAMVNKFKKEWDVYGTDRYVYRMFEKDGFKIVRGKRFKVIFEEIKNAFPLGAEYFHISEWNPK